MPEFITFWKPETLAIVAKDTLACRRDDDPLARRERSPRPPSIDCLMSSCFTLGPLTGPGDSLPPTVIRTCIYTGDRFQPWRVVPPAVKRMAGSGERTRPG